MLTRYSDKMESGHSSPVFTPQPMQQQLQPTTHVIVLHMVMPPMPSSLPAQWAVADPSQAFSQQSQYQMFSQYSNPSSSQQAMASQASQGSTSVFNISDFLASSPARPQGPPTRQVQQVKFLMHIPGIFANMWTAVHLHVCYVLIDDCQGTCH